MTKKTTLTIGFFTIAFLLFTGNAFTNSGGVSGPLSGSPESFGQTCTNCHNGGSITSQTITLETDIPASGYQENTDYTVTVKAMGNGATAVRGGINATVEDANGFAGSLSTLSGGGAIILGNTASHNSSSNTFSGDTLVWKFKWNSGTAASATLYTAVNFANGNGNTIGDAVATSSLMLMKSSIGLEETVLANFNTFPNPAQNDLNISFDAPAAGELNIWLYDNLGRKVKSLYSGETAAGTVSIASDVSDLPTGNYFLNVDYRDNLKVEKIIIN
jgi:hypothetical protein